MEFCKMEKKEKIPRLRESGVPRHRAGCKFKAGLGDGRKSSAIGSWWGRR